ncbi:MAG: hypothetical protein A2Z96_02450 [Spirochaetes bacterium GWB1_48_6]|nr:MAG: hypothetical protein A2Z96_02450 [Spirochaetes bacterium GWB1_48_6]
MNYDYKKYLKNLDLFKDLEEADLEKIIHECHECSFQPGEVIFRENEPSERFYIILEGQVEVWKDFETPFQDILAVKGEGASFGEMGLIDELPRSATIRAVTPTKGLYQDKESFTRIIKENTSIAIFIMKSVSKMVRQSNETFIFGLRQKNLKLEKAYEDLKKAQQELLRNDRLSTLGKFSSMIIHDLRNPISILRGYAEMIQLNSTQTERVESYASKVIGEADRLNRLAQELLDYSRGDIRLNIAPIQPREFFTRLQESYEKGLKARKIETKFEIEMEEAILLDQDRMMRVFGNLVDNARKAMYKGGTLTLKAYMEGSHAALVIVDTGEGMTKDVKDRMFDPFYSSSSQGGTGLGMLVVHNIIEAHKGHLEVDSEPGRGTAIKITLPMDDKA